MSTSHSKGKAKVESKQATGMSFDNLKPGVFNGDVVVRVIHFWEAKNLKKGGLLMGWELLLIDEKATTLQGFIPANKISRFESQLKANSIYKLTKVWVQTSRDQYRVSDHQYTVCFTDKTVMDEVEEDMYSIEKQKFRLRTFKEFDDIANTNVDLYDVMGQIRHVEGDNLHQSPIPSSELKRNGMIGVHLELEDGTIVRTTLWDKAAATFRMKYLSSDPKPVVALFTTVNAKRLSGRFILNAMPATRIYLDHETEPTSKYFDSLVEEGSKQATINSSADEVTKLETVSLAEIHEFLNSKDPQKASFICTATIAEVLGDYGWQYISCSKCSAKLGRSDTTLVCNKCNDTKAVGVIRFRVELLVKDKTDEATFVLFDRDASELTGWKAPALLDATPKADTIPQCFLDTIGMTIKFQVKVTEYNFQAKRQTITVSRILDQNQPNVDDKSNTEDNNEPTQTMLQSSNMLSPQVEKITGAEHESQNTDETRDGQQAKRMRHGS